MSELDCEETIRLLEGFADGELDAVTGFGVQEHLDHCEACRTRWRWHRDLAASLERIATERQHPPSPSLRRRVLRDAAATTGALESNESRGRSPRRRTVKRILMGAAGLLLILAPLMTGLSPESRGEDPSRLGDARDLPEAMDFVRDHEKVDSGEAKFLYASDPGATWTALKSPFADRTAVPAARIANYRFAGARFCRVGSRPVVHALYEKQGQRVSAFVLEEVLAEIDPAVIHRVEHELFHRPEVPLDLLFPDALHEA